MARRCVVLLGLIGFSMFAVSVSAGDALADHYLVEASGGPGPGTPAEAVKLLEGMVIPSFEMMMKWEETGKLVGGLPAGDRAFTFIMEAASNDEVDRMIRSIPVWPLLQWKVVPLQSIAARAAMERANVEAMKKMMK